MTSWSRSWFWCWPWPEDTPALGNQPPLEAQADMKEVRASRPGMQPRGRRASSAGLYLDRMLGHPYRWSQLKFSGTLTFETLSPSCWRFSFQANPLFIFSLLNKMLSIPPGWSLEISLWKVGKATLQKVRIKPKDVKSPPNAVQAQWENHRIMKVEKGHWDHLILPSTHYPSMPTNGREVVRREDAVRGCFLFNHSH